MTHGAILVVDDDPDLLSDVSAYLETRKYTVHTAVNTAEARAVLARDKVGVVVLDLILQGEDGITFCQHLHENKGPPVLILSQRRDVENRVTGLRSGAEVYLPKPFDPEELLARLEVVLRRRETRPVARRQSSFQLGSRAIDFDQETLTTAEGTVISLSLSETIVLKVLLSRLGDVIPREELIQSLRGRGGRPFERTVDNIVVRLRRKIEEDPSNPRWLKTVWGIGYRIVPDDDAHTDTP